MHRMNAGVVVLSMKLKLQALMALALASAIRRISPTRWPRILRVVSRRPSRSKTQQAASTFVDAVDAVSWLYPASVVCLQRAWAITLLCRRHAIPVQIVLGTRPRPFRAHAWVESADVVISDDHDAVRRSYDVIERFG